MHCDYHPARHATARCTRCDRALCLDCKSINDSTTRCHRPCEPLAAEVLEAWNAVASIAHTDDPMSGLHDQRPPKAVLDDFGAALASRLDSDGFRYVKARRRLENRDGPWTFGLELETSRYNQRGVHIVCDLVASVAHESLAKWRLENASPHHDLEGRVTYARFERLLRKAGVFGWNLVLREARPAMANHTAVVARRSALPWFDQFALLSTHRERLLAFDIPHLPVTFAFELWLALSGKEAGREFVEALRRHKPVFWEDMRRAEDIAPGEPLHFRRTLQQFALWT